MFRYAVLLIIFVSGCGLVAEEAEPVDLAPLPTSDAGVDASDDLGDASTADAGLDTSMDAATDATTDAGMDVGTDAQMDAGCTLTAERGAWMYRHPGNALGTDVIVGNAAEESTAIANLQAAQITQIYGNYGDRPTNDTAAIAAWNGQLNAASIQSQVLIGDGDDIFPGCREEMIQKVQARLIDFNAAVAPSERFYALHLDIEPQQYKQGAAWPTTTSCGLRVMDWPYWDDLDSLGRAERYELLRQTFIDVRAHLDANGHAGTPIYVDLAPWVDSSSNFDWSTTPVVDGADWLAQVATEVTGMTFMTYERDSAASIDSSVTFEATLSTELRVSVSAKERAPLSTTITWADLNAMWAVVQDLEAAHCGARPVDLFNYRYLHE